MTKRTLTLLRPQFLTKFILLISLFFIYKPVNSCYWGPYAEDIRVWIFNPTSISSADNSPFFYTTQFFGDFLDKAPDENIDAWYTFFDKKVNKLAIAEFIYQSSLKILKSVQQAIPTGESPFLNSLALKLALTKNQEFADYFVFAKQAEIVLNPPSEDSWNSTPIDIKKVEKLIPIAKNGVRSSKSNFLKLRYAYQAIVLMRYAFQEKNALDYYENTYTKIKRNDDNILNYWVLAHVAFCKSQLGKTESAQLDYLHLFNKCNSKKHWAYLNIDKKYFETNFNSLSAEDQINFITVKEFHNPGKSLNGIAKIAKFSPNSKNLITLLGREVNKFEDWLLTRTYTGSSAISIAGYENKTIGINYENDYKYLGKFIFFVKNLLKNQNQDTKINTQIVLAHLYFMHKEPEKAVQIISEISPTAKDNELILQIKYTEILAETALAKQFDANFEEKLWRNIAWIKKHSPKNSRIFANLMLVLHSAYHEKGMYPKAAEFLCQSLENENKKYLRWQDFSSPFFYLDKYATAADVITFVNLVNSQKKSNLDKFLFQDFKENAQNYYELAGTISLRNDDLQNATHFYNQLPPTYWKSENINTDYLHNNPFVFPTNSPEKPNYEKSADSLFINKAFFVSKLVAYKVALANSTINSDKCKFSYLLGSAYFNMSYAGQNWQYLAYGKSETGLSVIYTEHNSFINKNYSECTKAIKYFEDALSYTSDKQLKAEIIFTLASIKNSANNFPLKKEKDKNKYATQLQKENQDVYDFYLEVCPGLKFF